MKILSLFSGIGAFEKALENLDIKYELAGFSEIDKYAIKSYCAMHNTSEDKNLGDITKIDIQKLPKDIDLITHGSPCQDFSIAGKQAGADIGTGTRSSLMWNTVAIVKECKPKYVVWENVKNVLSKKHRHNFDNYLEIMDKIGYNNYYQVLNAKDYGIPQNRERVYTISIRKDIKQEFIFPKKQELKIKLRDILENEVDEKYYLSNAMVNYIKNDNEKWTGNNGQALINKTVASTINTGEGSRRCDASNYVSDNYIENLNIKEATKKGYKEAYDGDSVNLAYPESETRRGRVGEQVAQTLQCNDSMGVVVKDNNIYNLFFTIFDLCRIIDTKEKDKYERSRELLQILWEEIGKKDIWQEIRRFISIQEKKILQSNLYENELYEDRKPQSKISTSTPNSSEYNESITNREKMFDMWKNWKTRYTPQRWELSEQQFRQFNLFMQELSYETTQGETSMQVMWQTNERFRILQQTLFKIQEIWRSNENKISNGLRIRKLTPREAFRLMGFDDVDFEKASQVNSNAQLYKQSGNSIVVNVLEKIFINLLKGAKDEI